MGAKLLLKKECILGESPMWHEERNAIWWVDIVDRKIYEYNLQTNQLKSWPVKQKVSLLLQIKDKNDLLLCTEDGIALFNITTGSITQMQYLEKELPANRTNDGACDSYGRLWLGTMDANCKPQCGNLYCFDQRLVEQKKIKNTSISNGLTWSIDNKKLYYIDSLTNNVDAYFFDSQTGVIAFEKTVIKVPTELGMPDDMVIDSEGMLWIAHWGGFGIYRWNPSTGELIEKITVPSPTVTSCAFGYKNLDHLFITTARQSLNEADLEKYPLSGSVFIAKLKVKGTKSHKFKLCL